MIDQPNTLYFMVGTEAELMKLFPVINAAKRNGFSCKLITSGQNNVHNSPFLKLIDETVFLDICRRKPVKKNILEYLKWMTSTSLYGKQQLNELFKDKDLTRNLIVVHGDTLTTVIGSWLARQVKVPYVHIESGLRSHNFLSPFPEEFDRLYGSLRSVINFCPKDEYARYAAQRFKGKSVSLVYNTGIETLYWALESIGDVPHPQQPQQDFFLFMIHRQENLKSPSFLRNITRSVVELSQKMHGVFIFHEQTKHYMNGAGVFGLLGDNPNITLLPRQGYEDFVRLVKASQFVITDGVGNQQEMYYLGKPTLIIRTTVEKDSEGIGWNAKPFNSDFSTVQLFYDEYRRYKKDQIKPMVMPSDIIINEVTCYFQDVQAHGLKKI